MKIRIGFVANSSSASFCIALSELTTEQIRMIKEYSSVCKNLLAQGAFTDELQWFDDGWEITEGHGMIKGWTIMDNFDFNWYLEHIVKIPDGAVQFDGSNY